ncbi:hypothetical protein [Streptomyces sp. NPDC102437]
MSRQQLPTLERRLGSAKRELGLPVVVAICGSTRRTNGLLITAGTEAGR